MTDPTQQVRARLAEMREMTKFWSLKAPEMIALRDSADLIEKLIDYAVDIDALDCDCDECQKLYAALARFGGVRE